MKHSMLCCVLLVLSAAAVRAAPVCVSEGWWGKLYRVEDVNGDGDALDAGEATLWADGGIMANFTFLTADDTAIYAADPTWTGSSAGTQGALIRFEDLNGDGDALDTGESTVWAVGLGDPKGVCAAPDGSVYVVDAQAWPRRLHRLKDLNSDGDALDVGEMTLYTETPDGPRDLLWQAGGLYLIAGLQDQIYRIVDVTGDGDAMDTGEVVPYAQTGESYATYALTGRSGGGMYVSSSVDHSLYRVQDLNGDNDAVDVFEVIDYVDPVSSGLNMPKGLCGYGDGLLVVEEMGKIKVVNDRNGDGDAFDIAEVLLFAEGWSTLCDIEPFPEPGAQEPPSYRPGDANRDGKVDGGDLALWQQNYDPLGTGENTWGMGDWNDDGKVDGGDLALWQQYYDPIGTGGMDETATVPEPASLVLMSLSLTGVVVLRRLRFRRIDW